MPRAYDWAMSQDIQSLKATINRLTAHSLMSIGSGGSFTAASFQAHIHESITGKMSYATTPYQTLRKERTIRNVGVTVLSAEGKNKDILGCFQYLLDREPQDLLALTLKPASPLNLLATESNHASSIAYEMPWIKDGYLATNSLIAICVLLYRAYRECFRHLLIECPPTTQALLETYIEIDASEKSSFINSIGKDRNTSFLVVTGTSGQIAGVDLESRIAESAMGVCQVVDFRSFAHGRHLWAHQNQGNSAAIVIWSEEDQELYENFRDTIPSSLPVLPIKLKGDHYLRQLASVIEVVKLIKDLGERHGIDPGEPVVPESSRTIYGIDAFSAHALNKKATNKDWAILRKFGGAEIYGLQYKQDFDRSYADYMEKLSSTRFGSIVFDYDATLCTPDKRFEELDPEVAAILNSLLKQGVRIGIATGRGKSVPKAMIDALDKEYHSDFLVGMYNGSQIQTLTNIQEAPKQTGACFIEFEGRIKQEPFFNSVFKSIEGRPTQLSFETKDGLCCEIAWRSICELLQEECFNGLKALRSTHSWDVIEKTTSKINVSEKLVKDGLEVLSIGDRGLWPGNDCELLSHGLGLGVDEVSPIIHKAWNIAPQGLKGVGATLYYLSRLKVVNGSFTYEAYNHE